MNAIEAIAPMSGQSWESESSHTSLTNFYDYGWVALEVSDAFSYWVNFVQDSRILIGCHVAGIEASLR